MLTRLDWTLFRTFNGLQQMAGTSKERLGGLVLKELVDNALDAGEADFDVDGNAITVIDNGAGFEEADLATIFSINRPFVSSKHLRLPTRGALGNGLRVVVGAVIATGGMIKVTTRGKEYQVIPQADGTSKVILKGESANNGTIIELTLPGLRINEYSAQWAIVLSEGEERYKGKTSAYWYTSEDLFELCQSYPGYVRDLVDNFEGCRNKKEITEAFKGRYAKTLSWNEVEMLMDNMRSHSKEVNPERLGRTAGADKQIYRGTYQEHSHKGKYHATIPYVVEIWKKPRNADKFGGCGIFWFCNKTQPPNNAGRWHPIRGGYRIDSFNLNFEVSAMGEFDYYINIICPYIPIFSNGKDPNFGPMEEAIKRLLNRVIRKDKAPRGSHKAIVFDLLPDAIDSASGRGKYRFSQRQLYYKVRPDLKELTYANFAKILTDYENENGFIPGLYRDSRGTLYTPHTGARIDVGTISVEKYRRPEWTFKQILYIEKEALFEVLIDNQIPERFDIALLTSKGYASRAAKDLIDRMPTTGEEIQVFCIHDCDFAGTMIYQTLQQATATRDARTVKIINLGLDVQEALEMGLQIEKLDGDKDRTVADYVSETDKDWLQENRIELDAMDSEQFIKWIEKKLFQHCSKVIPPQKVICSELQDHLTRQRQDEIERQILVDGGYEDKAAAAAKQINEMIQGLDRDEIEEIMNHIKEYLKEKDTSNWKVAIHDFDYDFNMFTEGSKSVNNNSMLN